MKLSERSTVTDRGPEYPKPAWHKPTIRIMSVRFTQDGTGIRTGEEDPDAGAYYIPITS